MMKIYVASSWRNEYQPAVVQTLREEGFQVYDFRAPSWNDSGFQWSEIDPEWQQWEFADYMQSLNHEVAERGYVNDMNAMRECDACVLVQPCGRSAHLELGWFVGQGKYTAIYHPPGVAIEPELMAKMVHLQRDDIEHIIADIKSQPNGAADGVRRRPPIAVK